MNSIWNGANSEILSTWIGPEETAILLDARGLAVVYQDWRSLVLMTDVSRLYNNNNLHIGIVNIFLQKMGFTGCIFIGILYYVAHSSYSFGYLFRNHVYESIHDFFVYT